MRICEEELTTRRGSGQFYSSPGPDLKEDPRRSGDPRPGQESFNHYLFSSPLGSDFGVFRMFRNTTCRNTVRVSVYVGRIVPCSYPEPFFSKRIKKSFS